MNESKAVTRDPVCGMILDEPAALHVERDDKTFYFCGDRCLKQFVSAPIGANVEAKAGGCCS